MNVEAWCPDIVVPPVTLPDEISLADYTEPGLLTAGNEPTEVVILIEAEVFA